MNWVLTENYKEWIFEWLCLEYLHKYTAVQGHLKQWVEKVARLSCQSCQKVLSSRLIINSRQLWNSHQRHKFIRAKASRDIWKIRVSEMAFSGVLRGIFHHGCHVVSSEYTQDLHWEQCCLNVPAVPRHRTVWTFHRSKSVEICVIQNLETESLQFYSMVLIFVSSYCRKR